MHVYKVMAVTMAFIMLSNSNPTFAKKMQERNPKSCQEIIDSQEQVFRWMLNEAKEEARIQEDIKLLAEVIYWENWHTDKEKKTAYWTGAVVMNRVKSKKFPNTVKEVLYQKNPRQYSTTEKFFTKELPSAVYEMAEDIIRHGTPDVPENVLYQATFSQGKEWKRLNGEVFCYG